jgi:hypothetical protein
MGAGCGADTRPGNYLCGGTIPSGVQGTTIFGNVLACIQSASPNCQPGFAINEVYVCSPSALCSLVLYRRLFSNMTDAPTVGQGCKWCVRVWDCVRALSARCVGGCIGVITYCLAQQSCNVRDCKIALVTDFVPHSWNHKRWQMCVRRGESEH